MEGGLEERRRRLPFFFVSKLTGSGKVEVFHVKIEGKRGKRQSINTSHPNGERLDPNERHEMCPLPPIFGGFARIFTSFDLICFRIDETKVQDKKLKNCMRTGS